MDFISDERAKRYQWLTNLSKNIVAEALKMGLPNDDALAIQALADALITAMEETNAAETALKGKRAAEKELATKNIKALRLKIRHAKTLPGYPSSGSEGVLQLKAQAGAFDPDTYKPVITVRMKGGVITLEFKKKGVDGMAFYSRLRGTTTWMRIATDTSSPCIDARPLAQPGVPEVREYMARGMIGDDEIGLESGIVNITFGG